MRNRLITVISFIFMSFGVISIVWVGSSLSGKAFSQTPPQPVPAPVPGGTQGPPQMPPPPQQIPPPSMNLPPQGGQPTPMPQPVPPGQPSPNQPMPQPQPGLNAPPPDFGNPPADDEGNYDDPNAQMPSAGLVEGQPILPGLNPDGYTYDPTGRRDPFMPFGAQSVMPQPLPIGGPTVPQVLQPPNENSLTFFELAQLRVTAIMWDVKDPKAMIMDPKGKLHMIHKDSPIGRNNGFVYAIREGEIVVIEPSLAENGAQTAVSRVMYLTGK